METYKPNRLLIPEEKLILHSCYNLHDVQDSVLRKLLNEIEDWEYFIERSIDTLLAPVVYKRIRALSDLEVEVPAHVITKLHQTYSQIFVKNTFLFKSFHELLLEFEKRNIQVIPLKGIFLLENYYEDFGLRQISDLDLLVKVNQLEEALLYFINSGFEMEMYMPAKAATVSKTPAPYKFSKNGLVIDLHVNLTYVYDDCQFEMDEVWNAVKRSEKIYFEMNSLDQLVYLFAHLIKHFDYRNCKLINFYDLCIVLKADQIVVADFLHHAEKHGCLFDVLDVSYLLDKFFGIDFLNEVLLGYVPSRRNIDEMFLEILSTERAHLEVKYAPTGSTGFRPISYLSPKNKFVYVLSRIFPGRLYIQSKYGKLRGSVIGGYILHFKSVFSLLFSS